MNIEQVIKRDKLPENKSKFIIIPIPPTASHLQGRICAKVWSNKFKGKCIVRKIEV